MAQRCWPPARVSERVRRIAPTHCRPAPKNVQKMDWLALAESWTRARPGAPVPLSPSHERRPPLQGPAPLTHSELECWSIRVRVHRDRDSVSACDSDALGLVDCRAAHSGTGNAALMRKRQMRQAAGKTRLCRKWPFVPMKVFGLRLSYCSALRLLSRRITHAEIEESSSRLAKEQLYGLGMLKHARGLDYAIP